ncbi:MAG: hypothetical protein CUN55_21455, partial [Phototrophicales bacterium]
ILAAIIQDPAILLLQLSFVIFVLLAVVFWYQDVIVRPPRTKPMNLKEGVLTLISFPLLPVLTLIFVALPVLQAQTRLLVGHTLQYRVAPKI